MLPITIADRCPLSGYAGWDLRTRTPSATGFFEDTPRMALRQMLRGKIHRATITRADLDYVGSLTVDADLLRAADILPYEHVLVVNLANGARIETYAIEGEAGSGVICANGAAAHHFQPGDLAIIMAFQHLEDADARAVRPWAVFVDAQNRIIGVGDEIRPGTYEAQAVRSI